MTPQEYNGRMILDLCEMGDRILDSYQRQMRVREAEREAAFQRDVIGPMFCKMSENVF
jgi:hypothetical protein